MAGISGPYVSRIERGLRAPSDRVLRAIAGALRTTADALRREAEPDWVPSPAVLTAIAGDPQLTARLRQALAEIYRAFAAAGGTRAGRVRVQAGPVGSRPAAGAEAGHR